MSAISTVLLSDARRGDSARLDFAPSGLRSLEFVMRRGDSVVGRLVFSSDRAESATAGPTGREWILERFGTLGPFVTARRRGRRLPEATVRPDGWGGAAIRTAAGHALSWVRAKGCAASTILRASDGRPVMRFELSPSGEALAGAVGLKEAAGIARELPFLAPLGLFLAVVDWRDSPDLGLRVSA